MFVVEVRVEVALTAVANIQSGEGKVNLKLKERKARRY